MSPLLVILPLMFCFVPIVCVQHMQLQVLYQATLHRDWLCTPTHMICSDWRPADKAVHVKIITPPLVAEVWEWAPCAHPDRPFCEYIVRGIQDGFYIGFNAHMCKPFEYHSGAEPSPDG